MSARNFVKKILIDKNDYILEAYPNQEGFYEGEFFQFVYKIQKSPAAQKLELWEKGIIEIPRWIVYSFMIVFVFLAVLFSGSLYVLGNLKPDSIYNESCSLRPCLKAHNLKCIDKICTCESPKYYWGKCYDLAKYSEKCVFNSDCDQTQVLVCLSYSTCGCSSTMFWSSVNSKCIDRLTNGESCSGDQCKANIGLACNSGVCSCTDSTKFYWNGNMCVSKKNYNQTCYSTTECMDSEATYCDGSKCTCTNMQYFSNSLSKCTPRLGEDVSCEYSNMCLSPMFCSAFLKCSCPMTQYFNETINDCVDKKLNGETCLLTHHCRSDLGLTCQNNICLCTSPKYSWYSAGYECKLTYAQTTCSNDTDCNPSENLICSNQYNCTCYSNYFWSTYYQTCRDRLTYHEFCDGDQCKLNVNLTCIGSPSKCDCPDTTQFFWDGTSCELKKKYSESCYNSSQCLDSELTYCDGTNCVCTSTNYFDPNLFYCTPKLGEFITCPFNDSCITPMYCRSSTSKCECVLTTQYFNSSTNECVDKKSINLNCEIDHHCREDYGLECINGTCSCLSTHSWYSAGPMCKIAYSFSSCTIDSDCNPSENLVCSANPSGSSICDCIKVLNNETYWNGNQCFPAKSYNSSCSFDYECKTLTESTYCNTNTGKCECLIPGGFSTTTNKCKSCLSGEVFVSDVCFFISNNTLVRSAALSTCGSLAVINSTVIRDFLWTVLAPNTNYWISGRKTGSNIDWRETNQQDIDPNICPQYLSGGKEFFNYSSSSKCFSNTIDETVPLNYICQRYV